MKLLLISLLIAGLQQWAGGVTAPGCDDHGKGENVVVVKGDRAHAYVKCCDKAGKCKCPKAGKHEGHGVFTLHTGHDDDYGHKVVVRKKYVEGAHGKRAEKCGCKSGKCKCSKAGKHGGHGVFTLHTGHDDDDGHKVVIRKKYVKGAHGRHAVECGCKSGKCKFSNAAKSKCSKSGKCKCSKAGKHEGHGVFTFDTGHDDDDGHKVVIRKKYVEGAHGKRAVKCGCKSGKCKCSKAGKHGGHGVFTFDTGHDDDDGHKVVIRKKCVKTGHGQEGSGFITSIEIGDDDGRSKPHVMFFGDDEKGQKHGWLGVSIKGMAEKLADKFDIEAEGVIVVKIVGDGPAHRAGLDIADIILSIDDDDVNCDVGRAINLIKTHKPGDDVDIVVLRKGREKEFTVKLGELGAGMIAFGEERDDGRSERRKVRVKRKERSKKQGWLGVSISGVQEGQLEGLDNADEGVLVIDVMDDSPAAYAGIRAQDIIISVDDEDVDGDVQRAVNLIKNRKAGEKVEIEVVRDGREKEFIVRLGEREAGLIAFGQEADDDDDDDDFDDDDFFDDDDEPKLHWVGDDDNEPELIWVGGDKKVATKRGWLGVSIDNVPGALATQLDIEGKGVIVIDVVDDSPADLAGLKVHDIILSVDDDEVQGDTGRAVNLIKTRKPGDELEIIVLREGRRKVLEVELGSRPGDLNWTMKLGERTLAEVEEKIRTRGKILKKDAGGKWVMKDLGDLEKFADLPDNIKMFLPKSGKRSISISTGDDEHQRVSVSVERDGNVIVVGRGDDGEITVTRVDDEGNKKKIVYDDEDELRDADEEAFELYEKAGDAMVLHLDVDSIAEGLSDFDFKFGFDTEDWQEHVGAWQEHLGEWQEHFQGEFGEAQEAYEKAMEQFHEAMEQLKSRRDLPENIRVPELPSFVLEKGRFPGWVNVRTAGKPDHTFEVRVDGTIEVRLRKGDSEIVRLYEDEDDLRDRRPKLYKKYRKLVEVEEE